MIRRIMGADRSPSLAGSFALMADATGELARIIEWRDSGEIAPHYVTVSGEDTNSPTVARVLARGRFRDGGEAVLTERRRTMTAGEAWFRMFAVLWIGGTTILTAGAGDYWLAAVNAAMLAYFLLRFGREDVPL